MVFLVKINDFFTTSMSFQVMTDEDVVPSKEAVKTLPPSENDHLKLACIQSEMCERYKLDLQKCHEKITRFYILHEGETCDVQIFNFINCLDKCMIAQKNPEK